MPDLGFDPKQGVLRTQEEAHEVFHTAEILAPYYAPESWDDEESDDGEAEPTEWERAVQATYDEGGGETADDGTTDTAGPTSEAASAHSSVLHGVDFLHPLYAQGYEQVLIALGVDEHGLTPWTRRFRDAAPVEGAIAGLHTRMVPGFGDTPKLSKSIGAGVSMDMDPEAVRTRFANAGDGGDPAASPTFQAMCLASRYDAEKLHRLERACAEGGEAWVDARREYADEVAELAERWHATE
jgi:tryptophanyl-tRNA synthetase